jgi:preprotein translocase SecF subunit
VLEIVPSGTHIDFIGKRKIAFAISGIILLTALAAVAINGVKFGIDFAGGTEVQLRFDPAAGVEEAAIRSVAEACGVASPSVVRLGEAGESEFLVRFAELVEGAEAGAETACPITDAERKRLDKVDEDTGALGNAGTAAVVDRMVSALDNTVARPEIMRVEFVGPRVGGELRRDGVYAMLIAVAMILAYIAFRFSSRFAPGAIVALVHDVGITAGIFVLFGLEFDLRVLAALLAIIGYSLNDTIIIYDRIRENMALHTKFDLEEVLNLSVNQTLSRTLLTSMTTLLAVSALLVFGGQVIRPFALAMFIGVIVGTYSSIFVASPTLLALETYFGDSGGAGDAGKKARGEGKGKPAREKGGRKAARAQA